jgi:hypothetical protein
MKMKIDYFYESAEFDKFPKIMFVISRRYPKMHLFSFFVNLTFMPEHLDCFINDKVSLSSFLNYLKQLGKEVKKYENENK